jgi:hypothetical protein
MFLIVIFKESATEKVTQWLMPLNSAGTHEKLLFQWIEIYFMSTAERPKQLTLLSVLYEY